MSQCPTANEFGVRNNPVCIDGVDTTPFANITSVDITDITGITSATENVVVSQFFLAYKYFIISFP